MSQDRNRFLQLNALEADKISQATRGRGRLGDAVDADGRGRALNVVHNVVHALGQRGDVLTVKRRDERLVDLEVNLMGDLIALVLQVLQVDGLGP